MSLERAVEELKQKYSVIDTIYQTEFLSNSDQWLHKRLTQIHREAYTEQERILFVQDGADTYDYDNFPGRALITLQKYLSRVDISNLFVIVISSNSNVVGELEQVQKLYSTDSFPMQNYLVSEPKFEAQPTYNQDTFCVLPWMHLYIGPDGNVLPCCQADPTLPMGNIQTSSVIDIVKSEQYNRLRSNMLNGKRSRECSRCYMQEDSGLASSRIGQNQLWNSVDSTQFNADGTVDSFAPLYLDIRLNNICNLKCRMCSGYFSSSIAQEDFELFGITPNTTESLKSRQRINSLKEIIDYVPHAERIYFAGGEPLLAAEHYEILDKLIESSNTGVNIRYNTNFTNLKYKNRLVTDWWKQFDNITIGASLDAHGDAAAYIRHGTVWSDVEQNLELLREHCPHVNFKVTSTVSFLNIESLIELQKSWHELGRVPIENFSFNILVEPEHLTVSVLPKHHKARLDTKINEHIKWCNTHSANTLALQWQNVLTYMWSRDDSHHLAEFKRLTLLMDKHRNESFKVVFPEYEDLIDTN